VIDLLRDHRIIGTHIRMEAVGVEGMTAQPRWPPARVACTAYHKHKSQTLDHVVASVAMLALVRTGQISGLCAIVGWADFLRAMPLMYERLLTTDWCSWTCSRLSEIEREQGIGSDHTSTPRPQEA
jgi:hypothetical protein